MGINDLDNVANEMDVQDRYRTALRKVFKDIIFESKYRCDGLAYSVKNKVRMILEQKWKYNFSSIKGRAEVVAQVICYIKAIHDDNPAIMPKVAVFGNENECFVLPVKDIINYISIKEYNWSLAPSSMKDDKVLINDLMDDNVVRELYIYKPKNEWREIINKIKQINKGVNVPRTLTEKNIDKVFEYFTNKITLKRLGKKISPNDSVNLFAYIMLHPDNVVLNPKTKLLYTEMFKEPLSISNFESYISFITEFSRKYTPKQKHIFTAILDRLIEDTTRRNQGEFFTPYYWANEAHKYIASVYGEDWKEKYVVWDCAWGTGNLTRDYEFKELYASTLNQSDIDIANQMNYNPNAKKFRFDFLNDPYESLPEELRQVIESGKQIIILMNSPYGKPTPNNSLLFDDKSTSKGMTNTVIGLEMNNDKMGIASSQLYLQFIYRLQKMGVEICMFSTPGFLSQISNKIFRNKFLSKYSLTKGFIMNSSEFADVKSWGLTFSILTPTENENKYSFTYDVLERIKDLEKNDDSYVIIKTGEKIIYNTDNKTTLSEWMESDLPKNDIEYPVFESALGVSTSNKKGCSVAIGYINNDSNNVQQQNVIHLMSGVCKANGNKPITVENFNRMMVGFTARKSIKRFWLDDKDEFIIPNINHNLYYEFKNDSIIYSLFHIHSYQTSLREVNYLDRLWNVKNQLFWMSKEELMSISNQNDYNELYNDARIDSDRYVYNLLFGEERIYDQLSDEAKDVLDSATNLVRLSFDMRKDFANETNHLNSWDAGYAQLKLLWKEYYPEQFKEFREKYKVLEEKIRPLVYELGFLLK
jgi:hypothetical protein